MTPYQHHLQSLIDAPARETAHVPEVEPGAVIQPDRRLGEKWLSEINKLESYYDKQDR